MTQQEMWAAYERITDEEVIAAIRSVPRHYSSQTVLNELSLAGLEWWPGGDLATGTINFSLWAVHRVLIAASTAETNTLSDPLLPGILVVLTVYSVGSGGTRAITYSSGFSAAQGNVAQQTVLTFDTVQQTAVLFSVPDKSGGSTTGFRWELIYSDAQAIAGGPQAAGLTADVNTPITTTLANVAGLSVTVQAAKKYRVRAFVPYTDDATSGIKIALGGTATLTSGSFEVVITGSSKSILTMALVTALSSGTTGDTDTAGFIEINGTIIVNAAGTLTVMSALKTGVTGAVIKYGAYLEVTPIA